MANIDAPNGLRPVKHLDGSPFNGAANRYYVASSYGTAIFVGDAVKSSGTADSDGVAGVEQAAAGDTIRGVVVGVEVETANSDNYIPASTGGYVYVVDAPDVVFVVQEDSDGGALAATNVGQNADLVVGTGSTTTGTSAMEIDSSTAVGTTAQVRILGLYQRSDNEIGANAEWLVMINEHELKATAGV